MSQQHIHAAPAARPSRRITAGKLTGQKPALKMKEVLSIRARLELKRSVRATLPVDNQ